MIWCYIHTIDLKLGCNLKKRFRLGSHSLHVNSSCFIHSDTNLVNVLDFLWSLVVMLLWNPHKMCVTWGWKGVFGILLRFIKQESLVCILLGTFACHIFLFSLFTCYFDFHLLVIFKHNINYFLRVRKGTQFKLQHTLSHQ